MERITIDPITRLEGHGKIEIFLDEEGEVANAYLQIPELRGFEQFCVGRPAEEMPRITNRICGVCPEAHHMASTKALDALFGIEPSSPVKKLREMFYEAFYCTDHTVHFYALGGPDFVLGPESPPAERNILGVIHKVGVDIGKQVIACRQRNHHVIKMLGGRGIHPVAGLPGGWSKAINEEERQEIEGYATREYRIRPLQPPALRRRCPCQPGLRGPDRFRCLHPPHLLHGHRGRKQLRQLLRRQDTCNVDPAGKEFVKYEAKDYPQAHSRTRRALDLPKIPLS